MKEGKPVVWMFLLFIIIAYVGSYIWQIEKENDRLFKIASDQEKIIKALEEENRQLHTLTETMFQYIYSTQGGNSLKYYYVPEKDSTSPIHKRDPL